MNVAKGSTCEISPLLRFYFLQLFCYNLDDNNFLSDPTEETGQLSGISQDSAHDVTFSILNITTNKFISRSNFRLVGEPSSPNLRIYPLTAPDIVKYRHLPSTHVEDKKECHASKEKA